jgi:hypothetical protein
MTWASSLDEAMAVGTARYADVIAGCGGLSRAC